MTVTATLPGGAKETVSFAVTVSPATSVRFGPVTSVPGILFPAVTDINGDEWPELVGTVNDGTGRLVPLDLRPSVSARCSRPTAARTTPWTSTATAGPTS